MEATRSIFELKQYLDKFKKDMSEIDIRQLEEIPKFSIPNWPKEAGRVGVTLWLRSVFCPVDGRASGLLNLRKTRFIKIDFEIYENGNLGIWASAHGWLHSNLNDPMQRTKCFIIFSQLLDPLCNKIIKKLKKKYADHKKEAEEFNRICEAVKKSFEPLIPFIVADVLSDKEY